MDGTINYIYNKVFIDDGTLKKINKKLKTQTAIICIFAWAVCVTVANVKQQDDKIEKLVKEVEELKKTKGE